MLLDAREGWFTSPAWNQQEWWASGLFVKSCPFHHVIVCHGCFPKRSDLLFQKSQVPVVGGPRSEAQIPSQMTESQRLMATFTATNC